MSNESYERGVQTRYQIFGKEATDAQLAGADDFMGRLQELVTGYCFGENWSRELLPLKLRSMITIAMLAGQGREQEVKVHVRGALNNGVSRDEIGEVFLHAAVYAGVPAAVCGFRAASEVFAELDAGAGRAS